MPIPITCPHCGAAYTVADDLQGRRMLCRECDQSLVVDGLVRAQANEADSPEHSRHGRKRSPLGFVVVAIVILLALLPTAALGGLWWTGWLYDQVEWPNPPATFRTAPAETVLLRVYGLDLLDEDRKVQDDIASWLKQQEVANPVSTSRGDRTTMVLATGRDPAALAKTIGWASVRRVDGRVITVSLDR